MSNTPIPFDDVVSAVSKTTTAAGMSYHEGMDAFVTLFRDHVLIERIINPDGTVTWVYEYSSPETLPPVTLL